MCRSVPQIEVALTRTSTSTGPIVGTGTVSIARPFAACVFRSAFMVAGMPAGSLQGQGERHIRKNSMLAHRLVLLQRVACRNANIPGYDFVFFGFLPSIGCSLLSFMAARISLGGAGFWTSFKMRPFTF